MATRARGGARPSAGHADVRAPDGELLAFFRQTPRAREPGV